jgi:ferredoxin
MLDNSQAYLVLNVGSNATHNEIKQAYRKLVLESHPDRNDSEQDGKKFKLITEAYQILKKNNKTHNTNNQKKYSPKTEQEKSGTGWSSQHRDKTPEGDWSRYTKRTEYADPQFWQEFVSEFWKNYEAKKSSQTKNPYDFEIIQEKTPNVKASVDHSLCIGCCSCEIIAPQVFHINKKSKMNPKSNVINQNGANVDKIIDAAQTCPTKAIRVEESGKRLYPY